MTALTTFAPAKINWTLEVLGTREDGFHEVRSVMQTLELHDEVTFEAADSGHVSYEMVPTPDADLVARAATLLPERPARVSVRKRVPVGAGLGGGSSDAAATLRGLNALGGSPLDERRLAEMGAGLGSDVPFFVYGGTALVEGRGERVSPLPDIPAAWVVVVVPPIRIADKTRTMYATLRPGDCSDGSRTAALAQHLDRGGAVQEQLLYNAFERAAYEVFAGLKKHRDWLLEAGAPAVHLCGAGAALFALASGEAEALAIRRRMTRPKMGERVHVTRTTTRAEATLVWSSR